MTIAEAKRYVELANKMLELEVVKERTAGATWQQIGTALGITHQGARSRWGPVCKAVASQNGHMADSANGVLSPADHAELVDGDGVAGPGDDRDQVH